MKKLASLALAALASASIFAADLPRPVMYLQSSGSQYIDLGVKGRTGLEIESEMEWVSVPSDNCYLGSRKTSGDTRFFVFMYNNNGWYLGYQKNYMSKVKASAGVKYKLNTLIIDGEQRVSIDDQAIITQTISGTFDSGYNLYLFGVNNYGSLGLAVSAKCYNVKIWDYTVEGREGERTLIREYLPYLDKDGKPCLYDTVEKGYYYPSKNLSYEEFPKETTLDHYVEYVESTGSQYVDTELNAGNGLRVECDIAFTEIPSDGAFFGVTAGGASKSYLCHYASGSFCWANGQTVTPSPKCPATVEERYKVRMDLFTDYRGLFVNDVEKSAYSTTSGLQSTSVPYYMFALDVSGSADYFVKARCYGVKVWKSSDKSSTGELEPVYDFHPCVDNEGSAALYDTVTKRLFYAKGGDLVAGPDLAQGGIVVATDGVETEGEGVVLSTPAPDTYTSYSVGQSIDFQSEDAYRNSWKAFSCTGYTAATSEDGAEWSAESDLNEALSCTHVYDGTWWRITWQWRQVGCVVSNAAPAGATVTYDSEATPVCPGYYPVGSEVLMTASETDGNGGTFCFWNSSDASVVRSENRTLTVVAANNNVVYTPYYRYGWSLVSEKGAKKTITDGIWTVEVEDGCVNSMTSVVGGSVDFSGVEADLGFKITSFKERAETTYKGPQNLVGIVAPDVTSIGAYTFAQCANLQRAEFSCNLSRVGRSAFYACPNLSSLTPSLGQIVSQVEIRDGDHYAFYGCRSLVGDLVISRNVETTFPMSYLHGIGVTNIDMSGCRKTVAFSVENPERGNSYGMFAECTSLVSVALPPVLSNLPRCAFFGCSKLEEVAITGELPAPEDIGYFYGYLPNVLKLKIPLDYNPDVFDTLKLRAATDAEKEMATFPLEDYEHRKFIGVFDTPTSGWGVPDNPTRTIWVVKGKPKNDPGLLILVK